ncbi:MAG: Na/Pi cotransporter family protein [Rhizobiaceae bacterium]|nr:Na/Pi cotransporter family protein [Rhizobiaceae bacterium]
MEIDIFREIIVPVIGGLGIFMLGLEFMSSGIQSMAVNKMRALLAKTAGTPVKGVLAGTLITGVLQSSTAMTVMVVGLVNAGVIALRPAISVIMGANIGTTLGNGLIALPLGPLGLLFGGFFALVYVFTKSDKWKNIAYAAMGFALIFYGLSLMTGGLRPLRNMPEVIEFISVLNADSFLGVIYCVIAAAIITALIHSSSATIGIVMGLGASGVLDWETAVAFSLGADLGTTITSFIASLNLSKNAKRAAYAHISFNFIGVAIMLPLFFVSLEILRFVMGFFGGDPAVPVMVEGKETFPLVPVAVGLYSIGFNLFNTILLFPFIGTFEKYLLRVGHSSAEDIEDFSQPKFLDPRHTGDMVEGVAAVRMETNRYLEAATKFLDIARGTKGAPDDVIEHYAATDILNREIRGYTASMFKPGMPQRQSDILASLIEEEDFIASLGETLYQIARRVERQPFSAAGRQLVNEMLDDVTDAMHLVLDDKSTTVVTHEARNPILLRLRERCLKLGEELPWVERGAILALLGSAERSYFLIERIDAERRSVSRDMRQDYAVPAGAADGGFSGAMPQPAE